MKTGNWPPSWLQLILPLFSFRTMFFAILGHCLDINLPPFCASAIFIVLTSTLPPYFLLQPRLWNLLYVCVCVYTYMHMTSIILVALHDCTMASTRLTGSLQIPEPSPKILIKFGVSNPRFAQKNLANFGWSNLPTHYMHLYTFVCIFLHL